MRISPHRCGGVPSVPIDVLVSNAGIGLIGAFEATSLAQARKVFETNTFGVMAMTQALLP